MILRVPDYFDEFCCIADKCKDSCCIGWEIDIDEDTRDYYLTQTGELKEKFDKYMYQTEDGEYSFDLVEQGRCPFLTEKGLCELCTKLGEESLSEVCTEYPRFAITYGDVLQKCLSLSCEEAGRILFEKKDTVELVDREFGADYACEDETEEAERIEFLVRVQNRAIGMLQDRSVGLSIRVQRFLSYLAWAAEILKEANAVFVDDFREDFISQEDVRTSYRYEDLSDRLRTLEQMEVLGKEWRQVKENLNLFYSGENYEVWMKEYLLSLDYKEEYYEKLLVYFFFRYFMNSAYDSDVLSYGKLAVVFTLMIRDMNALRFIRNERHFGIEDMIDDARIFSKEVEHSEDNVELAREDFLFEEAYDWRKLIEEF